MTISEFINSSRSIDNEDGTWSVFITLKNGEKSELIVEKCNSDYEAKERAFLFLTHLIENK